MSVWEYEGLMEKLIWKIKYDGMYDIINELVEKAFERIELNLPEDTYITYVPMYKKKEKQRGFNQAELIARKIGQLLGLAEQPLKVVPLLTKIKDNRSQTELNPRERLENVKGVFQIKSEARNPKSETNSNIQNYKSQTDSFEFRHSNLEIPLKVVLVDDVYTTGATMNECKKVLQGAGIKNIWGFTLARRLSL
jgi:predicted amidophosphoribosyltransferase